VIGFHRKIYHFIICFLYEKNSYKKQQWRPPSKKKKRGQKTKNLSPRNRKACRSVSTALLNSVAEIGTQSAMNNWITVKRDDHGQGKWEGKQKGKRDKRITESKTRQMEALHLAQT
jgi:hypothetical protein